MSEDTTSAETHAENRPACSCKAYPFLLIASTTIAAVFCFMYVTKPTNPPAVQAPVAVSASNPQKIEPVEKPASPEAKLLPDTSKLPGDEAAPVTQISNDQLIPTPIEPNPDQP
jgi:hypothetical protein